MVKLSAAIITFNEGRNIKRCLQSLQGLCEEIVVVDSFSTDKTQEICSQFNVRFIQNPFKGHIEQKNFALDQCTHEYVLSLDADEAVSKELRQSIIEAKSNWQGEGYHFNRLTNYVGHWVRHCSWYPDKKVRLVRKSEARWEGVNPHDILKLKSGGKGSFLKGDLLHYSYPTVSSHIQQTDYFTNIAAKASFQAGVRSNVFKIITRPMFKFIRDFIFKLGFLDGRTGYTICKINALSAFLKYTKIKELQEGKEI